MSGIELLWWGILVNRLPGRVGGLSHQIKADFGAQWEYPASRKAQDRLQRASPCAILFDPRSNSMNRFSFPHFMGEETKAQTSAQGQLLKRRARMKI